MSDFYFKQLPYEVIGGKNPKETVVISGSENTVTVDLGY